MGFDYDKHLRDAEEARRRYESVRIETEVDCLIACRRLDELQGARPGTWEFMEAGALEDAVTAWKTKAD